MFCNFERNWYNRVISIWSQVDPGSKVQVQFSHKNKTLSWVVAHLPSAASVKVWKARTGFSRPYLQSIFAIFLNPKLQCISTTDRRMSMPLSFFMWSMNGQTRVISGIKKREASSRNLHIVKNVNESRNISSVRIFPVFDRFHLLTLALIFSWQTLGKKIETVAWTHCFRRSVFSYRINITKSCNVYFASYGCEQITGAKNYDFVSSPCAL